MFNSINNYSSPNFSVKKEEEIWEILPQQSLDVTIMHSNEEAKAIVLFVHGGPGLNKTAAIKTQELFFTDLTERKFHVIAPFQSYELLNEPDVDYRDLLNGIAKIIAERFPSLPLCVISHSYGAHLTGQTLLRDGELSNNIKKWVVLSGTTHHAAGNLRHSLTDIVALADAIPKDRENRIIWDESYLHSNERNVQTLEKYTILASNLNKLIANDILRYSLEGYHDVNINNNSVISNALNEKFSVHYHLPKIKQHFPILIVHPIEDCAVTVDVGLAFFKALRENGWPVQFATEENSPHNWMKNNIPHSQDHSYQPLFDVVSRFLSDENLDQREVQNAIEMAETYLKENPDLNYMEKFRSLHNNEQITFTSFNNEGLALVKDVKNKFGSSVNSQGIKAIQIAIDLYKDPFKKDLQKIELKIKEVENKLAITDPETDQEVFYYLSDILDILRPLAEK